MKKYTLTFTVLAIALLAIPALTLAQGGPRGGGDWGGPDGESVGPRGGGYGGFGVRMLLGRLGDKLELTDEQREQIEAIAEVGREQAEALHEQMQEAREAFHESNDLGTFDEAAARAFADSQSAIRADLMVQRMKTHAEIFNILTPEQQEELKELRELFGDRPGRGGGKAGKAGRGFGSR